MSNSYGYQRFIYAALGAALAGAAASAILFAGAGATHAATADEIPLRPRASCVAFDPQPDPPRPSDRVNPGRGLNPSPGLSPSPGLKGDGSVAQA